MITYVDTSSLLKLLIQEPGSQQVALLWDTADALAAIPLVEVEARAALAAAERGARLTAGQHVEARSGLRGLLDELTMVAITDRTGAVHGLEVGAAGLTARWRHPGRPSSERSTATA